MKLISMWEPWATLYVLGQKRIETRGWATYHKGWIAVHATKGGLSRAEMEETCGEPYFREALRGVGPFHHGCIIGLVRLVDCYSTGRVFNAYPELDTPKERAFGDYEPGRFGLVAGEAIRIPEPIPWKSRQGMLLDLDAETVILLREQWKRAYAMALHPECVATLTQQVRALNEVGRILDESTYQGAPAPEDGTE